MSRSGYVLLPVAMALALVAATAFLMNRVSALDTSAAGQERQATEARYVAEAGFQHAARQVQNASCTGYANLGDTAFGDHSYQATVVPSSDSPVTISATGTLASGAQHTVTRDLEVFQPRSSVAIALDGSNGRDTSLDSSISSFNTGGSGIVMVGTADYPPEIHALVAFDDLSAIPASAEVLSATLELEVWGLWGPTERLIAARRATQTWVEGTKQGVGPADGATWNTFDAVNAWAVPGGDAEVAVVSVDRSPTTYGEWMSWDVTPLVRGWVDGSIPNHGVLLSGVGTGGQVAFSAQQQSGPNSRPRLLVSYACECGGGGSENTTLLQPGPTDGVDTYLQDGAPTQSFGGVAEIRVSEKTNNKDRGLLHFDLSAIPAAAIVSSATLELNLEGIGSGSPDTVFVHEVLTPWTETGATWNEASPGVPWTSPGGDYDPTPVASAAIDPLVPGPTTWDVKALVQDWVTNGGNEGFMLLGTSTLNHGDFTTSDATTPSQWPKLTVVWECACGADCTTPGGGPQGDHYRDEFRDRTCNAAVDYAGSQGSLDWTATPWVEISDSGDPCTSNVSIRNDLGGHAARMETEGAGIERAVDLSGFTIATLRFAYRRELLEPGDEVSIEVSSTGGAPWTELGRLGNNHDDAYKTASYDISAHAGPNTAIRFVVHGFTATKYLFLDDVQIDQLPLVPPLESPATIHPTIDNRLREGSGNLGSDPLRVGRGGGPGRYNHSFLLFDLTGIPDGSLVNSAMLRLHATDVVGSVAIGAYRSGEVWIELGADWNTSDGSAAWLGGGGGTIVGPALDTVVPGAVGWVEWDVAPLVQEWLDGVSPNEGIGLVPTGSVAKSNYLDAESREAILKPELVVDFTAP